MGYRFRIFVYAAFLIGTLFFLAAALRDRDPLLLPGVLSFLVGELSALVYLEFLRERDEEDDERR